MRQHFRIEAPGPGASAARDGVCVIWQELGRWLIVAEIAHVDAVLAQFNAALGDHGLACDISDGLAILRVDGRAVLRLLAKCIPLDLDPTVFSPNAAAATLMHHMDVMIWRREEAAFTLACKRSLGRDMLDVLVEAGAEFGVKCSDFTDSDIWRGKDFHASL